MADTLANPLYYLDNFRHVLSWVGARHHDLLNEAEQDFIATFPTLPQAAQALLVRMVMRKGELFRASRLSYAEIGDTHSAARPLAEQGWIQPEPPLSLDQLANLLRKDELATAFSQSTSKLRKEELLAALQNDATATPRPLSEWWPASNDQIYALTVNALCDRLRLLYFGNLHQDWSTFVLADLGIFQYEQVPLTTAARAFQSRADIDHYLELYALRERLHEGEPCADIISALPDTSPNPWLAQRRHRLLFQLGQQQEKTQDWPAALHSYNASHYPGARARRIRVLEKLEDFAAAHALACEASTTPESEEEAQAIQRVLPRLRRQLKLPAQAKAITPEIPTFTLSLPADPEQRVEALVLQHFHRDEAPVFYVENALINSLFGLLCWPAIFAPLPGAFFHPYQSGPADLHAPDFANRRADMLSERLSLLENGGYQEAIWQSWREKQGMESPFVFWGLLDEALLTLALDCIPSTHLRLLFTRLLSDIAANRSGFPDLIQFWPAEQRYQMLEVKGPGDRVQDNQRRWLDYCLRHGLPVAVCHVMWATP